MDELSRYAEELLVRTPYALMPKGGREASQWLLSVVRK
jgi:hypothetical protein